MAYTEQPIPIPLLTKDPHLVHCLNCGATAPTQTEAQTGLITWLTCCGISLAGCGCGCCLIPFCCDGTKDVTHRCSSCQQVLHTYERL